MKEEESREQRSFKVQVIHSIEEVRLPWRVSLAILESAFRQQDYYLSFAYMMLNTYARRSAHQSGMLWLLGQERCACNPTRHVQFLANRLFYSSTLGYGCHTSPSPAGQSFRPSRLFACPRDFKVCGNSSPSPTLPLCCRYYWGSPTRTT